MAASAADAIVIATRNAARAAPSSRLGTIEAGKLGDLVPAQGRPDADINNAKLVELVIRTGRSSID